MQCPNRFVVATLNCWLLPHPWPIGSKDKHFRLLKLIEELRNSRFDVVALQEVWSEEIFLQIAHELNGTFPHSHYFHSGFTGSGTCVISKHPIVSTLLHRYSLNGFPHHVHRADWFGGKIVGMVEIMVEQYRVAFYTTHLHAEYNRENDLYLPHRISQCFEMSQFIRHTSRGSDFVVVVGDFNLEPNDLGYHLIKNIAQLFDAWEIRSNLIGTSQESGSTCERFDNYYTPKYALRDCPDGKRLDYVMYRSGKTELGLVDCTNCFNKITGSELNFSDHVGITVTFSFGLEKQSETLSERMRQIATEKQLLTKSLKIIEEGEVRVLWDRRLFLGLCVVLIALIVATANIDLTLPYIYAAVALFRFMLTLFVGFSFWYGFIGLTIEMKALKETKYSIKKLLRSLPKIAR
uniref:sphingomyelin phosphodiesterase n=1 Tax=Globodera rostochiensis TaxID=31243 RepID=A0A914HW23_GLORO